MDYFKYAAGYVAERREIVAKNIHTGKEVWFKNRTEMYGRGKGKDKGWIGEQNARLPDGKKISIDDFEILDVQIPEPVEHALFTAKRMFEKVLDKFQTKNFIGYMGKGDSWRVGRSTILCYKGNRENTIAPVHKDAIADYLVSKYKLNVVSDLEADDWVCIDGMQKDRVVVTHDKDGRGTPCYIYNPQQNLPVVYDCRGFGNLWINEKDKLEGWGRLWLYAQVALGDAVDNYFANSASPIPWGDKSVYKAFQNVTNDIEALRVLKEIYLTLYPSPVKIIGWRGNEIEVDWLYVLRENFDLARMRRTPDDIVDIKDVLDKYNL